MSIELELLKFEELLADSEELERRVSSAVLKLRDHARLESWPIDHFTSLDVLKILVGQGVLRRPSAEAAGLRMRLLEALQQVILRLESGAYLRVIARVGHAWPRDLWFVFRRAAILGDLSVSDALLAASVTPIKDSVRPEVPEPVDACRRPTWAWDVVRDESPLIDRKRVAEILHVSLRQLQRILAAREMRSVKRAGESSKVLVPRAELVDYLVRLQEESGGRPQEV